MSKLQIALTQINRFNTLAYAQRFCDRAIKRQLIVLGDEGQYWATSPRWASVLVKAGYQYAN